MANRKSFESSSSLLEIKSSIDSHVKVHNFFKGSSTSEKSILEKDDSLEWLFECWHGKISFNLSKKNKKVELITEVQPNSAVVILFILLLIVPGLIFAFGVNFQLTKLSDNILRDVEAEFKGEAKFKSAQPSSNIEALERIASLKEKGILNEEEFQLEKKKILNVA